MMRSSDVELLKVHASGGMAEVYQGRIWRDGIAQKVAVKKILPHYTRDPDIERMFLAEAKINLALEHPNIVRTYDLGTSDKGEYFIVMEFADGKDLAAVLSHCAKNKIRMPLATALAVVDQLLDALSYAHSVRDQEGRLMGLIHRDISPHNVILCYDGIVKLTDFGIAKIAESGDHTRVGVIKGKMGYLSPEQAKGEPLNQRSDLYNIGILLYEMMTSKRLFPTANQPEIEVLLKMRDAVVPSIPTQVGCPPKIETLLRRVLSAHPHERPANALATRQELFAVRQELGLLASHREVAAFIRNILPPADDGFDDFSAETAVSNHEKPRPASPILDHGEGGRVALTSVFFAVDSVGILGNPAFTAKEKANSGPSVRVQASMRAAPMDTPRKSPSLAVPSAPSGNTPTGAPAASFQTDDKTDFLEKTAPHEVIKAASLLPQPPSPSALPATPPHISQGITHSASRSVPYSALPNALPPKVPVDPSPAPSARTAVGSSPFPLSPALSAINTVIPASSESPADFPSLGAFAPAASALPTPAVMTPPPPSFLPPAPTVSPTIPPPAPPVVAPVLPPKPVAATPIPIPIPIAPSLPLPSSAAQNQSQNTAQRAPSDDAAGDFFVDAAPKASAPVPPAPTPAMVPPAPMMPPLVPPPAPSPTPFSPVASAPMSMAAASTSGNMNHGHQANMAPPQNNPAAYLRPIGAAPTVPVMRAAESSSPAASASSASINAINNGANHIPVVVPVAATGVSAESGLREMPDEPTPIRWGMVGIAASLVCLLSTGIFAWLQKPVFAELPTRSNLEALPEFPVWPSNTASGDANKTESVVIWTLPATSVSIDGGNAWKSGAEVHLLAAGPHRAVFTIEATGQKSEYTLIVEDKPTDAPPQQFSFELRPDEVID